MQLTGFRLAILVVLIPSFLSGAGNPKNEIVLSARISDCSEEDVNVDVSVKNNTDESVVLSKSFLEIGNIQFKVSGSSGDPGKKGAAKAQGNSTIEFREFHAPMPIGEMEITVAPNEIFGKCISFSAVKMLGEAIKEKGRIELQTELEIANHDASSWDTLIVKAAVEGICK